MHEEVLHFAIIIKDGVIVHPEGKRTIFYFDYWKNKMEPFAPHFSATQLRKMEPFGSLDSNFTLQCPSPQGQGSVWLHSQGLGWVPVQQFVFTIQQNRRAKPPGIGKCGVGIPSGLGWDPV